MKIRQKTTWEGWDPLFYSLSWCRCHSNICITTSITSFRCSARVPVQINVLVVQTLYGCSKTHPWFSLIWVWLHPGALVWSRVWGTCPPVTLLQTQLKSPNVCLWDHVTKMSCWKTTRVCWCHDIVLDISVLICPSTWNQKVIHSGLLCRRHMWYSTFLRVSSDCFIDAVVTYESIQNQINVKCLWKLCDSVLLKSNNLEIAVKAFSRRRKADRGEETSTPAVGFHRGGQLGLSSDWFSETGWAWNSQTIRSEWRRKSQVLMFCWRWNKREWNQPVTTQICEKDNNHHVTWFYFSTSMNIVTIVWNKFDWNEMNKSSSHSLSSCTNTTGAARGGESVWCHQPAQWPAAQET